MIRNDREYRHAKEQLGVLQTNLERLSDVAGGQEENGDEEMPAVVDAVRMQMEDLRSDLGEYEDLKEGRLLSFEAGNVDSLGEIVTKARIASGLTQEQLAEELGMTQQQIQRYERDGYQKISLWRLAEMAEALELDLNVRARLPTRVAAGRSVSSAS